MRIKAPPNTASDIEMLMTTIPPKSIVTDTMPALSLSLGFCAELTEVVGTLAPVCVSEVELGEGFSSATPVVGDSSLSEAVDFPSNSLVVFESVVDGFEEVVTLLLVGVPPSPVEVDVATADLVVVDVTTAVVVVVVTTGVVVVDVATGTAVVVVLSEVVVGGVAWVAGLP